MEALGRWSIPGTMSSLWKQTPRAVGQDSQNRYGADARLWSFGGQKRRWLLQTDRFFRDAIAECLVLWLLFREQLPAEAACRTGERGSIQQQAYDVYENNDPRFRRAER